MAKPKHRVRALIAIVLYKLYELHINDDPREKLSLEEICALFQVEVSRNLLRSAIESMRAQRGANPWVARHGNGEIGHSYSITFAGILAVEEALLRKDSLIRYYSNHGDSVIDEIAGIDSTFKTDEEHAEADQWSPLSLDRESEKFIEATKSLEKAIEAIEQDNGFAATYPDERSGILATLQDGLIWLKERAPTRAQVRSFVLSPLQWVIGTFGKSFVGEAAKEAWKRISDLLW